MRLILLYLAFHRHTVLKMSRTTCYNILATFAVIMALNCGLTIASVPSEDDPSYINLPAENITCIERELNRTNTMDPSCAIIQGDVAMIYEIHDAYDVLDGIDVLLHLDGGADIFGAFCQPSCMQTFFEAWKTCSSFDELSNVADLLTGLCSTNNGIPCYADFDQIRRAGEQGYDCFRSLSPQFGDCHTDCRVMLSLDVETYGCCLNVIHNYVDTFDPIRNEEVDHVFDECRVRRPADCPINPTDVVPEPTTAYPSAPCPSTAGNSQNQDQESENPQANQQGMRNGSSQPIAVAAIFLLLNSLIAVFIH